MPGPTGRYEQIQGGAACRLAFSVVLDSADKAARDSAGWDDCLDMLDQVVDGRTPERPYLSDKWRGYYEEHKRRGFPRHSRDSAVGSDPLGRLSSPASRRYTL
jgi:hypothetical protein